jgi:Coenzyme PQQ synthesis protein D (PqqD)
MLNNNQMIVRKKLPWQELDEKVVILSPQTKMSHELNETLSWIWKELEHQTSFSDLLKELVECFEVDETIAKEDLLEILHELKNKDLKKRKKNVFRYTHLWSLHPDVITLVLIVMLIKRQK